MSETITPQDLDDMDFCIRNCEFWKNTNKDTYNEYRRLTNNFDKVYKKYLVVC